jgi:hypothetical protein
MKKILDYRKLFGATKSTDLRELKSMYRNLMKEWHPDKFEGNEEEATNAEAKSKAIIEAYHYLVSVSPETIASQLPDYTITTNTSAIVDYEFKNTLLKIIFANGSSYEYFDVPKAVYVRLVNTDKPVRFAKRHIYHEFQYRKLSNADTVAATA